MQLVELPGVTTNYRRVGHGSDIVLVHGLAANHAFWHLDVLLPLAREYAVTVYDLRGHGYSSMPPTGYTSADLAQDLGHLLDYLEVPKAHLVGHSVGGIVALHYAVLHPERVASLTLADSRIRALQPNQRPADWPNWPVAKQKFAELGLDVPDYVEDWGIWLLEQLASPKWRASKDKLKGTSLFIPFSRWGGGNRSAERWLELLSNTTARQDFTSGPGLSEEQIASLQVPLLAMYGGNSSTMPSLRGLEALAPHCRSVIVPNAGHFFPLSFAALFVETVCGFLQSLPNCEPTRDASESYAAALAALDHGARS